MFKKHIPVLLLLSLYDCGSFSDRAFFPLHFLNLNALCWLWVQFRCVRCQWTRCPMLRGFCILSPLPLPKPCSGYGGGVHMFNCCGHVWKTEKVPLPTERTAKGFQSRINVILPFRNPLICRLLCGDLNTYTAINDPASTMKLISKFRRLS